MKSLSLIVVGLFRWSVPHCLCFGSLWFLKTQSVASKLSKPWAQGCLQYSIMTWNEWGLYSYVPRFISGIGNLCLIFIVMIFTVGFSIWLIFLKHKFFIVLMFSLVSLFSCSIEFCLFLLFPSTYFRFFNLILSNFLR